MHNFDVEFFIEMLKIIKNISVEFLIYSQIIRFALQVKIFIKFLRIVFFNFLAFLQLQRERDREISTQFLMAVKLFCSFA